MSQSNGASIDIERNLTTFGDIPVEVLLLVYEHLNLTDLSGIAKINHLNQHIAEMVIKKRDIDHMFWINVEGIHVGKTIFVDIYYNETFNQTIIDSMLNTLQMFGHLITRLTLDYTNIDVDNCERINEHLTKYASNSMDYLIIQEFSSFRIAGLWGPFKKVRSVRFESGNLNSNDINLNDVFPALQNIHFQSKHVWYALMSHQLPNLKSLNVQGEFFSNLSNVEHRLKLNSQIEQFNVKRCNRNCLKMIEQSLPNIEHLYIDVLDSDSVFHGDKIHFENAQIFWVLDPWESHQLRNGIDCAPVVFGNLEEFVYLMDTEKWIDVMLQNKRLRRIFLGKPTDKVFERIVTELPDLKILWTSYEVKSIDDVKKVVQFIEMAKNLKSFSIWLLDEIYVNEIHSRLHDQWRLNDTNKQKIAFIRV